MSSDKLLGLIKIGNTHKEHLLNAYIDIKNNYPFTSQYIANLSTTDLRILDTLTGRFSKLQDFIGAKLIDEYINKASTPMPGQTIIDKINRLEKLNIIENANLWIKLRDVRNHIAHEYPDNPKLAAEHLNNVYALVPALLEIYDRLSQELLRLP